MTKPEPQRGGGWLEGLPTRGDAAPAGTRLGLPASGPGSVASFGARLAAIVLDTLIASGVAALVLAPFSANRLNVNTLGTVLFAAVYLVGVSVWGRTPGMYLMRLRVLGVHGRPPRLHWNLVRTVLLMLIIPPLLQDGDMRGVHDRASGTVVVRVA
jgi:uncharacterized RDD family membrane protein YckC